MSAEWSRVPFESLYSEPSRNGVYKSKEFHGAGAKIVNMGELFGYEFIGPQDMKRVQMSDDELAKSGLDEGDLLFGRRSLVEEGAGKCSLVRDLNEGTTFESSLIRVRLDKSKAVPGFYYYWFKSHIGRAVIKAIVTGTNVKGIKSSNLKKVRVAQPIIDEQRAIVEVISKYDDLIENNKRRIDLLEESARQLYKEWFVRLRFPGHEHVKIVDGAPESWRNTNAFEVLDVLSGGTPKTSNPEFWDGDIPFFTPKDATSSIYAKKTIKTLTESGLNSCSSGFFPKDTLFITARGTVGKLNLAQVPMAMNQSCYALVGKKPLTQFFLYFALGAGIQQVKSRAVGAVFDAVIKDTFKVIPFTVPTQYLIDQFTDYVSPTVKQIDVLTRENENLEQARNLLLPKIMNGEIAV